MTIIGTKLVTGCISAFTFACLMISGSSLNAAETPVIAEADGVPTLTAEQPVNPVSSKPGGPILTSISVRLGPSVLNVPTKIIIPQFHFIAPNGNAVLLRREVVESSANNLSINPSAPINTPPDAQKNGAVITGSFNCNTNTYHVTIRAYVMDADGNRSNSVQYTVHCNGG